MRCKKAQGLLSPYLDGELPVMGRKMFESHLNDCANCRAEFDEMQALHNLFAGVERFSAPYGFAARTVANIETAKAWTVLWTSPLIRVAGVVMVLIIIGIGILSGNLLERTFSPQGAGKLAISFSLDVFNAAPPDSLGGVYLAMTEGKSEKL